MAKIGFIGAGNMAFALAKAIKEKKLAKSIILSDINQKRLDHIKKELKIDITKNNHEVIKNSDIIFLAVKPQIIDAVLNEIKGKIKNQLIISIAAGVKLKRLESILKNKKVIRVMPNTPCLVGEMAAGFAVGKKVTDKDILIVEKLLNAAGKAYYLKESALDAVTGLSGSGPAFVARLIEAFIEAGKKQGLSKDIATELTLQTFKGTATLLEKYGMSPEELVQIVSSPNGTTVAGRSVLERSDYRSIISQTIDKAVKRSKELGK
ncbi:MAG: pyrroline-5-carboxylate reductase [Nanoarchaeota archaeon]